MIKTFLALDQVLKSFPKTRSTLPLAYQKIYENEYKDNRTGVGLIGKIKSRLEDWMHMKVSVESKKTILEVGAGTLNHVKFERGYLLYDIIEPMPFLYKNSKELQNINNIYKTSKDLKENILYSNIISIAVFEHMTELPLELIRLIEKLEDTGKLQTAIPTEGSLFWYLSWRFITGIPFYFKYKLDYKPFMRHEHVNSAEEIEILIKYLFFVFSNIAVPVFSEMDTNFLVAC